MSLPELDRDVFVYMCRSLEVHEIVLLSLTSSKVLALTRWIPIERLAKSALLFYKIADSPFWLRQSLGTAKIELHEPWERPIRRNSSREYLAHQHQLEVVRCLLDNIYNRRNGMVTQMFFKYYPDLLTVTYLDLNYVFVSLSKFDLFKKFHRQMSKWIKLGEIFKKKRRFDRLSSCFWGLDRSRLIRESDVNKPFEIEDSSFRSRYLTLNVIHILPAHLRPKTYVHKPCFLCVHPVNFG